MIIRMIENQKMVFTIGSSQSTTHDLNKQHFAFGWATQYDAPDIPIDTGRQRPYIADHLDASVVEAALDRCKVRAFSEGILIGCTDPALRELRLQVLGVRAVHSEDQRRTTSPVLKPCFNSIANELNIAHPLRQLALVVLTSDSLDAFKIRVRGAEDLVVREQAGID